MKLSVFSPVFNDMSLEAALQFLSSRNVFSMELGCGGFPGTRHADAAELIKNTSKRKDMESLFKKYGVEINALSVHGNAVHPVPEIAAKFHDDFVSACKLAKMWNIKKIITFSGCPGGSKEDTTPNWITCPWPNDFSQGLKYQWNDVLIPYWKRAVEIAKENGVDKIALELHPGFCCYNPETLKRLRAAVGDCIGANFDPSHLFWQGIDPAEAVLELKDCIFHFHAKDTKINERKTQINGVLDTKPYGNEIGRSWVFRTVGYGHGGKVWKEILSNLNLIGYTDVVSIEHEDSIIVGLEGLEKAIVFLQGILPINGKPKELWWE